MLLMGSSRPIMTSVLPVRSNTALSDSTISRGWVVTAGALIGMAAPGAAMGAAAGAAATAVSGSPHSSQNAEPSGFSWPCEQRMVMPNLLLISLAGIRRPRHTLGLGAAA